MRKFHYVSFFFCKNDFPTRSIGRGTPALKNEISSASLAIKATYTIGGGYLGKWGGTHKMDLVLCNHIFVFAELHFATRVNEVKKKRKRKNAGHHANIYIISVYRSFIMAQIAPYGTPV